MGALLVGVSLIDLFLSSGKIQHCRSVCESSSVCCSDYSCCSGYHKSSNCCTDDGGFDRDNVGYNYFCNGVLWARYGSGRWADDSDRNQRIDAWYRLDIRMMRCHYGRCN